MRPPGLAGLATLSLTGVLCLSSSLGSAQSPEKPDPKRPSLSLRATPPSGTVPVRIFVSAELKGGDDDYEDYYCPTVEWTWGDGTVSASTADCEPYEAGKSQIRRRFSADHLYKQPGGVRVTLRLKKKDRVVGSIAMPVQLMGVAPPY